MIGMLWYDNDPKSDLASKIYQAVDYYMQKYHQRPNLCFVHPAMIHPKTKDWLSGVEVRAVRYVPLHNFYLVISAEGQ